MSVLPFVSIIIPFYNQHEFVATLLEALSAQDYPHDRFECLIIDNGSDNPPPISADAPIGLTLLEEQQPGSYAARNRGMAMARGEVLAFTDADCIPQKNWLSSAVAALTKSGENAMIGGKVEVFSAETAPRSAVAWCSLLNDLDQLLYISKWHFAATANMITTRAVIDKVGPFDGRLFSGGDREWGRRAWSTGVAQVYAESVVVRHPVRATWGELVSRRKRITGGQFTLNERTGRGAIATALQVFRLAGAFMKKVWNEPRIESRVTRLQLIGVDWGLRLVQLGELARLWLGGRPCRK